MKKHQIPIAPSLLSSYACEFAHFSVTIKPGAQHRIIGGRSKMFIGERRTKKTPIRSRLLGLLIVERVSRKPKDWDLFAMKWLNRIAQGFSPGLP
jgi:hypothetical protein